MNNSLPSLIDVEHDRPLVLSKPAYINGQLYQPGEIVGIYDAAGDKFFTPAGPDLSAREMRMQIGMVIRDPRHVAQMQAEADTARRRAEVRSDVSAMIATHNALMEEIARPVCPRLSWPSWLVWLFTLPAPLPVLKSSRTSVIARHGFGGAGARA